VNALKYPVLPSIMPLIPPHPDERDCRGFADWHYRAYLELDAVEASPGEGRRLIRRRLPMWGLTHLLDDVVLIATELLTNSMAATREHGWAGNATPVRLWLLGNDTSAAVRVWDGVPLPPAPPAGRDDELTGVLPEWMPDTMSESGRGIGIVACLSAEADFYFQPAPFWGKITRATIS
jgi:anti-sigma regulatory factor (Ser/Thr protein kinase)